MVDWLKDFDWRKFWNPAIALGLAIAVLALAIKNRDIALFGLGIAACGAGERTLELYTPYNRPIGFAIVGFGLFLMALGLYHIITS